MQYLIFLVAALILMLFPPIAAAQEIQFSTYQELARVVTDIQTGNTSALITLQSGSTDEMMLPGNLREIVIDDSIINSFLWAHLARQTRLRRLPSMQLCLVRTDILHP